MPPASAADSALAVPLPPPDPGDPPPDAFTRMHAQVEHVPLTADRRTLMQAASAARSIGDLWRAEELLRALLSFSPTDPVVRARLASTLALEFRLAEARSIYDSLRKDNPKDIYAYLGLASVAFMERNRGEAWKWMEQAADKCRDDGSALTQIARRYEEWTDYADAERVVRHAQAVAPGGSELALTRASILQHAGKHAEARNALEEVTVREPGNQAAWKALAKAWSASCSAPEHYVPACQAVQKAQEVLQGDAEVLHCAAVVHLAAGQPHRAAQDLEQALESSPNHMAARYMLAKLYGKLGKPEWEKAELAIYERICALTRDQQEASGRVALRAMDPIAHLDVGRATEKLGDYTGALREYQIAVTVAPANAAARSALEKFYDRMGWGKPPKGPGQ